MWCSVGVPCWGAWLSQRVFFVYLFATTQVPNGTLIYHLSFVIICHFVLRGVCRAVCVSAVVSFGRGCDFR